MSGMGQRRGWRGGRKWRAGAGLALAGAVSGCATLPVSGPTGQGVLRAADGPGPRFHVVELADMGAVPQPLPLPAMEPVGEAPPTDLIGADDVLDIAIYEAGVTLFAGAHAAAAGSGEEAGVGAAQAEHLPPVRVDDAGYIRLPYAGSLRAAGHTQGELAALIRIALRGMSQDPQVVVGIAQSVTNSVIVGGEVGRPGRLVLSTNRERLSDVVALSGGYRGEAKDLAVRVVRGGRPIEYRLADVLSGPERDMGVLPGDRIELLRAPESFAVMGAAGKVEQMAFPAGAVSLAEAAAMAGGASPYFGDAKAVFVFRFVKGEGGVDVPVVYHLNMLRPGAYFIAQRFAMRDKDLLYIGNAASNQPGKLIQLVSQLFAPVVAVETGLVATGAIR